MSDLRPTPAPPPLARQLRWLIVVRLLVITSVAVPYFLLQLAAVPARPLTFDILFLLAGATYFASLVYAGLLRLLSRHLVLNAAIQFGGDLLLITGLVYAFGGITSPFSLLYLIDIAVAAAMLRQRTGIWVATAAYALYAGVLAALFNGWIPEVSHVVEGEERLWRLVYNLAVHLFGFYAVALLTSFLAQTVSRAERELAAQRDSFADLQIAHRDVVQSISSGLLTTDLGGSVTSVNRAGEEILGHPERDLVGRPVTTTGLFTPEGWLGAAARAGGRGRTRSETELVDGERRLPVGYSISRLTDAHGTQSGFLLVFQDLSDWQRLQQELRLKDRMAAAGELAAGLAHELGNPLAAISGSVQLLAADPATDPSRRKLLDIIARESLRLDRTIKGFLRFARPRERETRAFDVGALLAESFELLRNSTEAAGHELRLELEPRSATIAADPDQVSQIFWNLARNALRAMPGGGALTMRGELAADRYRIIVRDDGQGMSDDQRARIFQPFHSFFDGGTGLGMAIVYRIVQEHGGAVHVDTSPGHGTEIVVELPLTPRSTTLTAEQVTAS
ncbi:MAG: PAS domain S-box protein [Holophagales bacterium]|nr:MAG: PAS domain S-box protein [Holophagales bacterium]